MKARLGDTVAIPIPSEFRPATGKDLDRQLQETLLYMAGGPMPDYMVEKKDYFVLTTQEMVDDYNASLYDD